jgi:hypothetical protein
MRTSQQIKGYLEKFRQRLTDRHLHDFWVMPDRKDFKPIKDLTKADIKRKLVAHKTKYAGKNIAYISFYINTNKINTADFVMSLKVSIKQIDNDGKIDNKMYSTWGTCINFYTDDMANFKMTMKFCNQIVILTNKKILTTDTLNGTKYSKIIDELNTKRIILK